MSDRVMMRKKIPPHPNVTKGGGIFYRKIIARQRGLLSTWEERHVRLKTPGNRVEVLAGSKSGRAGEKY